MSQEPNFEGEEMKLPENEAPYQAAEDNQPKGGGWLLMVLFILLSLVLAGLIYWYFLATQIPESTPTPQRPSAEMNQEPETTNAVAEVESFGAMSTSDEITAIEADLESTGLDNLDAELLQIEAELEANN
ncbi:MAG TPA: hypothetical protein PKD95_02375 [Candidatus Paceibacterota bacterium]|nr:hypothetical protein [Candidatus Paceibacterota bacterium]